MGKITAQLQQDGVMINDLDLLGFLAAAGDISDFSVVNKFGQNNDLNSTTFEDIWDGGGLYSYPADGTAPITKVDSSSASDTNTVEVQGLDIDGNLVVQTATLTGTTPVTLTTPLWRVFRMKNNSDTDYVGTVQCVNDADDATYAQIAIGNNQTLMALYTIPAGKTGYLVHGSAAISDNNRAVAASGRFLARPYGGVFQLKETFGLTDSSPYQHKYYLPFKAPEKTDIRVQCKGDANGVVVNATFAILLRDN